MPYDILPGDVRKAAVDALYKARNDGKVMDKAAEEVAKAVIRVLTGGNNA
jgi:hypothetical protein